MFGLSKLASAARTLTDNVLALARTVADLNAGLRSRLALDAAEDAEVIEHKAGQAEAPAAEDAASPRRNGRKASAAG